MSVSRGGGGWTSSIHIYIASFWAETEGGEDEELGRVSVQKCLFVRLLILILRIHECPAVGRRAERRGGMSSARLTELV